MTPSRRRRIAVLLLIAIGAVAGSYAWYQHWRNDVVPLPDVEDISEMRVHVAGMNRAIADFETQENEKLDFVVPRKHWRPILDSLRPYHRGMDFIEKGYVPGELRIRLRNGREFTIVILLLSDDEVFFSIGPKPTLYAGGDKRNLYAALKAVEKASEAVGK